MKASVTAGANTRGMTMAMDFMNFTWYDGGLLVPAAVVAAPDRGISQDHLPLYLGFFEFVHNGKTTGQCVRSGINTGPPPSLCRNNLKCCRAT